MLDAVVVEVPFELEESDEVDVLDGVGVPEVLDALLDESALAVELELEPPRLSVL